MLSGVHEFESRSRYEYIFVRLIFLCKVSKGKDVFVQAVKAL
jgi:hypothetical protein